MQDTVSDTVLYDPYLTLTCQQLRESPPWYHAFSVLVSSTVAIGACGPARECNDRVSLLPSLLLHNSSSVLSFAPPVLRVGIPISVFGCIVLGGAAAEL